MILFDKPYNNPLQVVDFHNFFSPNEEYNFNHNLESLPYEEGAVSIKDFNSYFKSSTIRSSRVKWIPLNKEWEWLYQKFYKMIDIVNSNNYNFNLTSIPNLIQYTEYHASDNGHYTWHTDIANGEYSHRKISTTIQLSNSNEYEGGDLEFNINGSPQKFYRKKNTAAIFPSYLLHRVTPVTKGIRKSLVLWVGGEPFK